MVRRSKPHFGGCRLNFLCFFVFGNKLTKNLNFVFCQAEDFSFYFDLEMSFANAICFTYF